MRWSRPQAPVLHHQEVERRIGLRIWYARSLTPNQSPESPPPPPAPKYNSPVAHPPRRAHRPRRRHRPPRLRRRESRPAGCLALRRCHHGHWEWPARCRPSPGSPESRSGFTQGMQAGGPISAGAGTPVASHISGHPERHPRPMFQLTGSPPPPAHCRRQPAHHSGAPWPSSRPTRRPKRWACNAVVPHNVQLSSTDERRPIRSDSPTGRIRRTVAGLRRRPAPPYADSQRAATVSGPDHRANVGTDPSATNTSSGAHQSVVGKAPASAAPVNAPPIGVTESARCNRFRRRRRGYRCPERGTRTASPIR